MRLRLQSAKSILKARERDGVTGVERCNSSGIARRDGSCPCDLFMCTVRQEVRFVSLPGFFQIDHDGFSLRSLREKISKRPSRWCNQSIIKKIVRHLLGFSLEVKLSEVGHIRLSSCANLGKRRRFGLWGSSMGHFMKLDLTTERSLSSWIGVGRRLRSRLDAECNPALEVLFGLHGDGLLILPFR